ncbi:MAG: tandem-95 repeat protein, partial [candidate division Zixibacteria bacterium]|nr:tandem-95 repeat protein [candidate division Zixibacteria bacterium]
MFSRIECLPVKFCLIFAALVFTVTNVRGQPVVSDIPDQIIEQGYAFNSFDLDNYLAENDGDEVVWNIEFLAPVQTDTIPDWQVNPSDYQYTMTVTASVISRGDSAADGSNMLAAFAGSEVRGVVQPFEFFGTWIHFLTVYSNQNGEIITFRFFDNNVMLNLPVFEALTFNSDDAYGDVLNPYILQAGHLLFNLDYENVVTIDIVEDNWIGSREIRFIVSDMSTENDYADSTTATFAIIPSNGINDAPVASDDFYAIDEDDTLTVNRFQGLLANDYDLENDPLVAVLIENPTDGSLTLNADGSFIYTPDANFNGSDSFLYVADDGAENSTITTVAITIYPIDDAPLAREDFYNVDEDDTLSITAAGGLLANDIDFDNDPLTAILVGNTLNGSINLNPDGSFLYIPVANFYGIDIFSYRAYDGIYFSDTVSVQIDVNPINDAPIANDDAYNIAEDDSLEIDLDNGLLANDSDVDNSQLTVVLVTDPTDGLLDLSDDGSFTYIPDADFFGTDVFTYLAYDGTDYSDTALVIITVNSGNDPPTANDDTYNLDEDQVLTVTEANGVLSNDTDVENDSLAAIIISDPVYGSLTLNSDGSFIYIPAADFNGTDSFTYEADDGLNESDPATVTLNVNPINDAPILEDFPNIEFYLGQFYTFILADYVI